MTALADAISGFVQKVNSLLGKVEIQKQQLDNSVAAAQESLLRNFKIQFGGVGNDAADNTAAFTAAEASTADWIYLPAGIYRTTHLQLLKTYIGEGSIRLGDGYAQAALPPGFARPRSAVGPLRIESPNDIVLAPVGDIQASGRRIINAAPGRFPRDVATMENIQDVLDQIPTTEQLLSNFYAEGAFTPVLEGGTVAGVGTYTSRVGRYTRLGRLQTLYIHIAYSSHSGSGQVVIRGAPNLPASGDYRYRGLAVAAGLNRGAAGTLTCYVDTDGAIRFTIDQNDAPLVTGNIDQDGASIFATLTYEIQG